MNKDNFAISVHNLKKVFRVHRERNRTLKDKLIYAGRERYKDFIALDDVSVDIKRGSTVGLIGVNGSGKSTLLKIISKIIYPDSGSIQINGKVSSLLELGAGFHPDFTGEENIFLNGSLMGLSKKELLRKMDAIVDFSELGDFIKEPIRGYSSGMYMRLAFSIATTIDPDILLIDEILAVGDAAFQSKCMSRLKELQKSGKTIVLVSHDSGSIERLCDTAIWLDSAMIKKQGDPSLIIREYLSQSFIRSHEGESIMSFERSGSKLSLVEENTDEANVSCSGMENNLFLSKMICKSDVGVEIGKTGSEMNFQVEIVANNYSGNLVPRIHLSSENGVQLFESDFLSDMKHSISIKPYSIIEIVFCIEKVNLMPGVYMVDMELWTEAGEPLNVRTDSIRLTIIGEDEGIGYVHVDRKWTLNLLFSKH